MNEYTIREKINFEGVGVHTGKNIKLTLHPSLSGKIIFRRSDLGGREISLDPRKVEACNSSILNTEEGKIRTLEHLLAVFYVLRITSVDVELDGEEIPIMDGSSLPFLRSILDAGLRALSSKGKTMKILGVESIEEKDSWVSFSPDKNFRISYLIEFPHPLIKTQELSILVDQKSFIEDIAPARTFGFLKDVARLQEKGLALGGSLDNAVILDEQGVVNGPLRFQDEFVRHKILDFIGDLSLLGYPLCGHLKAYKAGHELHLKLVHFLLDHPESWEYISG